MSTLYSYIREGEHQTQDFKFRVDDAKKIARTLAAFANTEGGRLLIGVKDNGKVVGVLPEEEFHIIQGAAEMYCKPIVEFETKVWQDDHKLVLEVFVPLSNKKPHKAKDESGGWKTYVRRKDHTLLANKILIGVWKKAKKTTSRPQKFAIEEQQFLKQLKELAPVTLSKFYRKSDLKMSVIDHLLIQFISWGIVSMDITSDGTFYDFKEVVELDK